jgi:hypothetical protein
LDNVTGSDEISVDLVSMTSFVGESMLETWASAGDLNLSSIKNGWEVFVTVGALAAIIFISIYIAHQADSKAKLIKPTEDILTKAAFKLNNRRTNNSSVQLTKRKKPKLKMQHIVMQTEMSMIEKSLPSVLQSRTFTERFTEEIKHYHRWIGVVFYFSPNFPRVLRIISLVTNVLTMLFVQAITYKITNPDDGSCEILTTETTCLSAKSPFNSADSKCYWVAGYRKGTCHFSEPADNLTVILFVAIFAAIISAPIALAVDWLVMNILSAPTKKYYGIQSLDMSLPTNRARTLTVDVDTTSNQVVSLQEDLSQLLIELREYRETLTERQKREFNGMKNILC